MSFRREGPCIFREGEARDSEITVDNRNILALVDQLDCYIWHLDQSQIFNRFWDSS